MSTRSWGTPCAGALQACQNNQCLIAATTSVCHIQLVSKALSTQYPQSEAIINLQHLQLVKQSSSTCFRYTFYAENTHLYNLIHHMKRNAPATPGAQYRKLEGQPRTLQCKIFHFFLAAPQQSLFCRTSDHASAFVATARTLASNGMRSCLLLVHWKAFVH